MGRGEKLIKKDLGLVDLNLCFVVVINVLCNVSKVLIYRIKYFVLNRINEFRLLQHNYIIFDIVQQLFLHALKSFWDNLFKRCAIYFGHN